jgi:hypothetical protein
MKNLCLAAEVFFAQKMSLSIQVKMKNPYQKIMNDINHAFIA